jgi:hypothetical protein
LYVQITTIRNYICWYLQIPLVNLLHFSGAVSDGKWRHACTDIVNIPQVFFFFLFSVTTSLFTLADFLQCHLVCSMAQMVIRWFPNVQAQFPSHISLHGIYVIQKDIVTNFSPSSSILPCQYHSISVPYSFNSSATDAAWSQQLTESLNDQIISPPPPPSLTSQES